MIKTPHKLILSTFLKGNEKNMIDGKQIKNIAIKNGSILYFNFN